jgi:hypothetical protein
VYARRISAFFILSLCVVALAACLPAAAFATDQPAPTLTATPATLTCGASAVLKVQGATPGAALALYRKRVSDADFVKLGDAAAKGDGSCTWTIKPPETTVYRVDESDGQGGTIASVETTVGVRPRVTLAATAASPLIETRYVRYIVTVRPAHVGGVAQLQRWTGDAWEVLADVKLGEDSSGSVRLPAGKPGVLRVRAQMAADAEHLAGGSAVWKKTVYDRRNPYGVPTKYPHLILVDLSKYKLYYHEHGIVIRVFDCVLGRPSLPTPKGHYKVYAKDPHMGGPYGPYRMRYLGLYAVHGTNEPWLLSRFPRNYSHGCTRLSNTNITWLYQRVPVGTPVWNVP